MSANPTLGQRANSWVGRGSLGGKFESRGRGSLGDKFDLLQKLSFTLGLTERFLYSVNNFGIHRAPAPSRLTFEPTAKLLRKPQI
jgi:hypothetical protein